MSSPRRIVTHSGPFHADEVFACALLRRFIDSDAEIVRTRDPKLISTGDWVVDVGSEYAPDKGRFDHHQRSYRGDRSSAGMVLDWLDERGELPTTLADDLRRELVDHVDAVDNGRASSPEGVMCISRVVAAFVEGADDDFDTWFYKALEIANALVHSLVRRYEKELAATQMVREAVAEADAKGLRVLILPEYCKWKVAYFQARGREHPTDYVLFPAKEGWNVVTIPTELGSRDDKRKLPSEWAGLEGEELEAAVGVKGARFCHKNAFIAGFDSKEAALSALDKCDRLRR